MIKEEIIKKIEEKGGKLTSRQVEAVIEVFEDYLDDHEARIQQLEGIINP